jgi:hypothetical protein
VGAGTNVIAELQNQPSYNVPLGVLLLTSNGGKDMKSLLLGLLLVPALLPGQAGNDKSPVVSAAREALERQAQNLVEAAQEMPAEKYSFRPTPPQMTFGKLVSHVVSSNQFLCAKLARAEPPEPTTAEGESKEALVAALKNSFDTCSSALSKIDDSVLAEPVTLRGGRSATKAATLLALTNDWADHYAAAAMYLRLNGLLPPTAKGKKE